MQVCDLLTPHDWDAINQYIERYGDYGGYHMGGHTDTAHLLRFWNGAKSGFLSTLFGSKLILEREIHIKTPESILMGEISEELYPNGRGIEFLSNFYTWANKKDYNTYELLTGLIELEALASNIYNGDSFELSVPNRKHPLQINKGCKVAKILGKIAEEFGLSGFEEFRLKHSMLLNQKEFHGTLCLSIHPLDYMTMSDNDCNWDSCMSWQKPGEYREGTVEMMNSPYIIVAYLKAEKDMFLFDRDDDFTWANKRWRELFVVSPDVITGIRGYPYDDNILEREVFRWLMELVKTNCSWCDFDTPVEYNPGEKIEYRGEILRIYYHFNIMYDDFGSKHTTYLAPTILEKRNSYNVYDIMLSGQNVCMCCGNAVDDTHHWDTQSLMCPDCTGEVKCSICGDFMYEDSAYHMGNGDYLCQYCLDSHTVTCNYCDDTVYTEDSDKIYMQNEEDLYLDESFRLCDCCLNDRKDVLDKYYGKIESVPHPRRYYYPSYVRVINTRDMTLNGFEAFGYYAKTLEEAREML